MNYIKIFHMCTYGVSYKKIGQILIQGRCVADLI